MAKHNALTSREYLSGARMAKNNDEVRSGIMIAFRLSEEDANQLAIDVDGSISPDEIHLTLAYLGKVDEVPFDRETVQAAVESFAADMPVIEGTINGKGLFSAKSTGSTNAVYATFDSPNLPGFRQALVEALSGADVALPRNHGYTPHITLAYTDVPILDAIDVPALELTFETMAFVWGEDQVDYSLEGEQRNLAKRPIAMAPDEYFIDVEDQAIVTEADIDRAYKKLKKTGQQRLVNFFDAEVESNGD